MLLTNPLERESLFTFLNAFFSELLSKYYSKISEDYFDTFFSFLSSNLIRDMIRSKLNIFEEQSADFLTRAGIEVDDQILYDEDFTQEEFENFKKEVLLTLNELTTQIGSALANFFDAIKERMRIEEKYFFNVDINKNDEASNQNIDFTFDMSLMHLGNSWLKTLESFSPYLVYQIIFRNYKRLFSFEIVGKEDYEEIKKIVYSIHWLVDAFSTYKLFFILLKIFRFSKVPTLSEKKDKLRSLELFNRHFVEEYHYLSLFNRLYNDPGSAPFVLCFIKTLSELRNSNESKKSLSTEDVVDDDNVRYKMIKENSLTHFLNSIISHEEDENNVNKNVNKTTIELMKNLKDITKDLSYKLHGISFQEKIYLQETLNIKKLSKEKTDKLQKNVFLIKESLINKFSYYSEFFLFLTLKRLSEEYKRNFLFSHNIKLHIDKDRNETDALMIKDAVHKKVILLEFYCPTLQIFLSPKKYFKHAMEKTIHQVSQRIIYLDSILRKSRVGKKVDVTIYGALVTPSDVFFIDKNTINEKLYNKKFPLQRFYEIF